MDVGAAAVVLDGASVQLCAGAVELRAAALMKISATMQLIGARVQFRSACMQPLAPGLTHWADELRWDLHLNH